MAYNRQLAHWARAVKPLSTGLSKKRLLAAGVTPPPASSDTPPGMALSSGMTAPITGVINVSSQGVSAAADGSVWLWYQDQAGGNLQIFDFGSGAPQLVYESTPTIQAIAAASGNSVFIIATDSNTWIGNVDAHGNLQKLGSLPGSAVAAQISASSDGTLWVLDRAGSPWSYHSGSWTKQASSGSTSLTFQSISVGSANLIVGLGKASGQSLAAWTWTAKAGWQPLSGVTPGQWLSACADGALWSLNGSQLTVTTAAGHVQSMDTSALLFALGWTAASQTVAYAMGELDQMLVLAPFAYGILDMPPAPWPPMTQDQQTAYQDINTRLGVKAQNGIRALYADTLAPLSSWQVEISAMASPTNVSAQDWQIVQTQILTELTYVISVNNLFTQLQTLVGFIGTMQSDQLQSVAAAVGLTQQAQGPSKVTVVLNSLFSTFVTRLGSIFPPPYGLAISLIGSGLIAASSYTQQQVSPTAPSGSLQVAYSNLANVMANNLAETVTQQGNEQTAIVSDWGKLSAAGQAISQGIWTWPDNLTGNSLTQSAPVWELYFYQALMPAAWQILQGIVIYSIRPPAVAPPKSPRNAMLTKSVSDNSGNAMVWYYICCALGSSNNVVGNDGPYPSSTLTQNIFNLKVVPSEFFSGQNGWSLPVVQSPGWSDPPSQIPWNPYT